MVTHRLEHRLILIVVPEGLVVVPSAELNVGHDGLEGCCIGVYGCGASFQQLVIRGHVHLDAAAGHQHSG